jgi:hypothetical protein
MALFTTRLIQPHIDKKVFVILNFICIKKWITTRRDK